MKNVLVLGPSKENMPLEKARELKDELHGGKIFFLVHNDSDLNYYSSEITCLYREYLAKGMYQSDDAQYIKNQKFVALDDEILAYFEPFFGEILNQQRRFEEYHMFQIPETYSSHYSIFMHNLYFLNCFLRQNNITNVFMYCIPHEGYDSIIYHLCKFYHIDVRMVYNSTLPKRYYFLSDYLDVGECFGEYYSALTSKYSNSEVEMSRECEEIFRKYSSQNKNQMQPWYMKGNPLKQRFQTRFGVTSQKVCFEQTFGKIYQKYDYKMCASFLVEALKNIPTWMLESKKTFTRWKYAKPKWDRTMELNAYYEKICSLPDFSEKYIYYAMHYQPEASSNPLGGKEYTDQIIPIQILASSVPSDFKIYVKIHPEQLAPLRSKEYYEDINRIPNVKLISVHQDTYQLIKNAVAVSSLTGTVCWEAQFFGIPAILFGYSHKNLAPLSYTVRTQNDCQNAIEQIIHSKRNIPLHQLRIFTKALYDTSFPEDEFADRVFKELIDFIQQ